ncbi:MAG: LptA/OstA family protein [bacterium]
MIKIILTFFLLLMYNSQQTISDDNLKNEKLKLIHADSLVADNIDNQEVTTLFGNVKLVQGDAELDCQIAILYRDKRFAILKKKVQIFDGEHTLWADMVEYNGDENIETATGNVRIETNNRELKADTVVYHQLKKTTSAYGNVIIQDLVEHVILYGDEAFYDRPEDYAFVKGKTRTVKIDTSNGEKITIDGLRIDAWGQEDKIIVSDSVKIVKTELMAECGKGIFFAQRDTLILLNSPEVKQKKHYMKGDTIKICIRDMNFNGGIIRGKAEIISKDSTSQDELRGNQIYITAENDTIKDVLVTGQASSIYYIKEENERGKNLLTGDQIKLIFKNDSLKNVDVFSDPGLCTGKYIPTKNNN